jgi:pimeloyl-ACP methyl ester carboxylesterase
VATGVGEAFLSAARLYGLVIVLALHAAAALAAPDEGGRVTDAVEREVSAGRDYLPSPPGRLIDLGTHRLHLYCVGTGAPTVVFESGLGGLALEWRGLQAALAGSHRVCSYDRAGYGWSDPGPAPRTADRLAAELRRMLDRAGEPAPYVMVAHSFGGYVAQLFAKQHPGAVAGVVLVDSSHPDQYRRFPRDYQENYDRSTRRRTSWGSSVALPAHYPAQWRALAEKLMRQPKTLRAVRLEYRSFVRSGEQVSAAGPMPVVPAVVLTRGDREWPEGANGDAMEALWPDLQRELAAAMPRSHHFVIGGSGHHIHLDRPDAIEQAVQLIVEQRECGVVVDSSPAGEESRQC